MKKVCIIADCIDDQYAGIYTYATELIEEIEKNTPEDMEFTYIHYKKNDFFANKRELIIPLGKKFPGRKTYRKFFRLPRILKKKGFDIVHDLYHIAPFPLKDTPYKKVVTIHDLTPVLFPQYHVPQGRLQHVILPLVIHNADAVIAVSEHTKRDIRKTYGRMDNVHAVSLAAKTLSEPEILPEEKKYILYVSTIEPRKNVETLIRAFEKLKEKGYDGKLVLIGKKGWKCEYVFEMIERSLWREDIIRKGYVSATELKGYYLQTQVFVYPSHYEGFGLPVLEAMQYGIPVVAGNNSSLKEVVGDGGILFEEKNDEELVSILEMLLLNDESELERGRYAKKSLTQAARFSWRKTVKETIEVYREVMGERVK